MTSTKSETILGNARLVLADRVIEQGWIALADGCIAEFGEGDPAQSFAWYDANRKPRVAEVHAISHVNTWLRTPPSVGLSAGIEPSKLTRRILPS